MVNVPIAGVAIVAGLFLVPESRDPEAKPLDIPGALLSAGAITALIYAIIEVPSEGWTSPHILVPVAAALLLGIGFVIREMRTRYPLLDFSFFKRRRFSTGAGAISIMFLAAVGMMFGLTQYLQFVQGYTPLEAGLRFLPVAAGMMIGAMGSEKLVRRFGATKVVAGGLLLLAATLPLILLWEVNTAYWVIGHHCGCDRLWRRCRHGAVNGGSNGRCSVGEGGCRVGGERCNPPGVGRSQRSGHRFDNVLDLLQPGCRRSSGTAHRGG